jgi:hypothetical protein
MVWLCIYILKGKNFNFLFCLKYPWAYETVIFFYWEKSNPSEDAYVITKCCITLQNCRTCNSLLLFPDRWHKPIILFSLIHFNQITPHHRLNVIQFQAVSFCEEPAAFLFNYTSHRTTTMYRICARTSRTFLARIYPPKLGCGLYMEFKNLDPPRKSRYPIDDWAHDISIVYCETLSRNH